MNSLYSDDDGDNDVDFDQFITQNLVTNVTVPVANINTIGNKKQFIRTTPNKLISQTQQTNKILLKSMPKLNNGSMNVQQQLWDNMHQFINTKYKNVVSVSLKDVTMGLYDNQKLVSLICEVHNIESYGDTTSIVLQDYSGTCNGSILSSLLIEEPNTNSIGTINTYDNVDQIPIVDSLLLYLQNVTVFAPTDYQRSIIIGLNNIKLATY